MLTEEDAIEMLEAIELLWSIDSRRRVHNLIDKYKKRITERDSRAEIDKNYHEAYRKAANAKKLDQLRGDVSALSSFVEAFGRVSFK